MGTWKYRWCIIFSCFLCTETIMVLPAGTEKQNSTTQNQTKNSTSREQDSRNDMATHSSMTTMTELNALMSISLPDTSLVTPSTMRMVEGGEVTDTVPMMSAPEWSSLGVSFGSETTRPFFTMTPDSTATSVITVSGSAAPVSLRHSSPATSHSSSPVAPSLQQSSTSSTTKADVATTFNKSTALASFSPSSTPGIMNVGSGAVITEGGGVSSAASVPSLKPLASAAGTTPTSNTTEDSFSSTLAISAETQAALLTSSTLMLGQATTEVSDTSSSMKSPLPTTSMASAVSHTTALSRKSDNPTITRKRITMTTEPSAKTSLSVPDTSLTTSSSTSTTSNTTEASPLSTLAVSMETQAAWITSASLTLGQATSEIVPNSNSTGTPLSAMSMASTENRATTSGKDENPITNQGSRPTEPSAKTLPDTSLVTESMTNFRKSTPVYPPFTVNCLPASIKIQNVTGEAIHFSWTGGRNGSLYTISLMEENLELNRLTTKETKAAFKHLFPGHVYRISVAVLPCTDTNWTSVTIRTNPASCFNRAEFCLPQNIICPDTSCLYNQAFACKVKLKNETFNQSLYNSDSEEYKAMAKRIKKIVKEMRIKLKEDHFDITVLGFRSGSVIVYFISLLQRQETVDANVIQENLSQVFERVFGGQTEITVKTLPTGISSGWKVTVIVLGVLLGVALVLLLLVTLLYIYMKKRLGKYFVEPKGLLGNFVYKHL